MGKLLEGLYRILLILAILMALGLAALSIYGLLRGKTPEAEEGTPGSAPLTPTMEGAEGDPRVFSGLGTIRSRTAPPEEATVILSIAFPYQEEDRALTEELASHVGDFREITRDYFAKNSLQEIRKRGDERIKADLLSRFNGLLKLGRISNLYFSDFLIIE